MKRTQLFDLLDAVARLTRKERIVIVGSQSLHGQTNSPPRSVLRSLEVDIFVSPLEEEHKLIKRSFGAGSAYHVETGVYADPIGAGIFSPPPGWRERLVEISDDSGASHHWALEKHDVAVAKLIAGRDKDYDFLAELLEARVLDIEAPMTRAALMRTSAHSGALKPRLEKLAAILRERRWREMLPPVETLIATL